MTVLLLTFVLPVQADDPDQLKSPIHFKDYEELFDYIAFQNGLKTGLDNGGPGDVFKLAVDSKIDYHRDSDGIPDTAVIMPNYIQTFLYENHRFRDNFIRGAQGNGSYYVIRFENEGIDLIGILEGNGYSWTSINGKEALETSWHMSAREYVRTIYEWDGKVFYKTSSEDVKEDEDK